MCKRQCRSKPARKSSQTRPSGPQQFYKRNHARNAHDTYQRPLWEENTLILKGETTTQCIEDMLTLNTTGKAAEQLVVQEANRFREWKEKNDALADRRRAHKKNFSYLRQQMNQHLVDFLMLQSIEKWRKAIDFQYF